MTQERYTILNEKFSKIEGKGRIERKVKARSEKKSIIIKEE